MEQPNDDQILASAVRFLIDGGEEEAAKVLLSCSAVISDLGVKSNGYYPQHKFVIALYGSRATYDTLNNYSSENNIRWQIRDAFKAIVPSTYTSIEIDLIPRVEISAIDPSWRKELLEIARGQGVTNQAVEGIAPKTWYNLRFRSESEVRIAQALDRAGVLFFPNCKGRLNTPDGRRNREADFLVCDKGKWGILEVDGEPFHPPSRTVQDHERDRLFRAYGILVAEHFDAGECFENPDNVVKKFLEILRQSK